MKKNKKPLNKSIAKRLFNSDIRYQSSNKAEEAPSTFVLSETSYGSSISTTAALSGSRGVNVNGVTS